MLCTLTLTAAWAQPASIDFGVAYYDVGQLYDTFQSQDYNDKHFTEQDSMRWDRQRYQRKIEHTVRVIDSMALPVMILYGVENKRVVRDLVALSKRDYAYIHRDQNINNGLEFAVLYEADKFTPETITTWDRALCVEGRVKGSAKGSDKGNAKGSDKGSAKGSNKSDKSDKSYNEGNEEMGVKELPIAVIASVGCTSIGVLMRERGLDAKSNNIILIGQPSKTNFERLGLRDATLAAEQAGRGNAVKSGRWVMLHRAATSIAARATCEAYAKNWLLDDSRKPLDTFSRKRYRGGYSASLPIYIYFEDLFAY